ncbi:MULTISPECIES: hypothetical protein [Sphingomonas]|uniref:hypothetical protein n=1 Tax=Sphingomonas TaxID=13687 RepID=UPI000F7E71A5|nr:hypothetical protein [Sphingomonas sp. ABOLF]RSV14693.1 hypothetical protein CA235_11525 [Sphingomonas sp. ABOLF]GLK19306.1 hypothetical protein GCM10017606_01320 [Microbacterium terregens]
MTSTIALAGSGGSHPLTIGSILAALTRIDPGGDRLVIDLSQFDTRAAASYSGVGAEVLTITPASVGMRSVFRTAAANLLVSGGTARFRRIVEHLSELLRVHRVGVVLLCHNHGIPEQALIQACGRTGTRLAQIDEGPFSGMVTGRPAQASATWRDRMLYRLGLMPLRDQSGRTHDLFLPTSPARARRIEARGLDPNRIVTVAAPRFDTLPAVAGRWRDRAPDEQGRLRVVVLHQPFGRDGKVSQKAVRAAEQTLVSGLASASARRKLAVTLRAHPRSDTGELERLERMIAPIGSFARISTTEPLYDQLARHDMAIGFYSSALLEAAACGMPCASVSLPVAAFARPAEGAKAAAIPGLGIDTTADSDELGSLVLTATTQPVVPAPALFDQALGDIDGRASERIAHALLSLAGERSRT